MRRGVLLPNGEGFGDVPSPYFFLFSSSEWSDLVHSAGAIFYSSAACYTPKITELMVLKGEADAWSTYSWIRSWAGYQSFADIIPEFYGGGPSRILQTLAMKQNGEFRESG